MKLIALNSGGFDSVVMINELVAEGHEVVSLFFDWGQPNYWHESFCAKKLAKKLNIEHIEVPIKMPWVNTNMEEQAYIPMRNLVFASYAVSLAEQRGIKEIDMAIINNGSETPYFDCTQEFYNMLNDLTMEKDIFIATPLIECTKFDLIDLAMKHKVYADDYFSCNTPVKGEPCGECGDCIALRQIQSFILYSRDDFDSQSFRDAYYDQPVTEVRLLINNECQFDCKHCFYSFKEETSRRLTDVEFLNVIDEAFTDFGVESIHFSGKEPLINDKIFLYTDYIDSKFKDKVYDIVTNGVNIPKYLDRIKGCKNLRNIFLSVDTLENEVYIRNTNKHIIKNIKLLLENNIPLQITIDLTKGNYKNIDKTVTKLIELGVKNIYARAVKPIGQGVSLTQSIITSNDFAEVLNKLEALNVGDDINLVVHVAKDYIYEGNPKLAKYTDLSSLHHEFGNMTVTLQPFCMRFSDTVTVTSDGYVLGCGMDLANPKYSELACCNVKDTTLTKALEMSRERHLSRFIGKSKQKLCPILKN